MFSIFNNPLFFMFGKVFILLTTILLFFFVFLLRKILIPITRLSLIILSFFDAIQKPKVFYYILKHQLFFFFDKNVFGSVEQLGWKKKWRKIYKMYWIIFNYLKFTINYLQNLGNTWKRSMPWKRLHIKEKVAYHGISSISWKKLHTTESVLY